MFLNPSNARKLIQTHPVVVLTTVNKEGKVNAMTAAWISSVSLNPPLLAVMVSPRRYSWKNLKETGKEKGFVVNIPDKTSLESVYYVGSHSGKLEEDKIENADFTLKESEGVEVPKLKECVAWIECRVKDLIKEGDHSVVVGKILEGEVEAKFWSEKESRLLVEELDLLHHLGDRRFFISGEIVEV